MWLMFPLAAVGGVHLASFALTNLIGRLVFNRTSPDTFEVSPFPMSPPWLSTGWTKDLKALKSSL